MNLVCCRRLKLSKLQYHLPTASHQSGMISDLSRGLSSRTLPVFLKREVLNVRYRLVYYYIECSHKLTALCERHCKITKKMQTDKTPVCIFFNKFSKISLSKAFGSCTAIIRTQLTIDLAFEVP